MFGWLKRPQADLLAHQKLGLVAEELNLIRTTLIVLQEELRMLRGSQMTAVQKMCDKLIEMAMTNKGNAREAVAIRAQERMDSAPFQAEPPEEDEEEEWPPKGTVELTVP